MANWFELIGYAFNLTFLSHVRKFTNRAVITPCPSKDVLRDFNDGRISNTKRFDQITDHLGACDRCIATLDRLEQDPLAQGLRQSLFNGLRNDEERVDPAGDDLSDSFDKILSGVSPSAASWKSGPSRSIAEHRYRILAYIGEGSFGRMFLAKLESEELFAVKISNPRQLVSSPQQKQFLLDCDDAASLKHPNVHPVVDHGFWDEDRMFYSSRYVEAPTLTDIARNSVDIDLNQAMSIFSQICEAIDYAHGAGIIHRHIHPHNILLEHWDSEDDLIVRVTDFGMAFDSRYQFELLEPKTSTSPFDSPECANNDAAFIDTRADIFSLGKILKLLTRIARPRQERATEMLTEIVDKSTSTRRRTRYKSVDDLRGALRKIPLD